MERDFSAKIPVEVDDSVDDDEHEVQEQDEDVTTCITGKKFIAIYMN